jgi:hypothetical protein
MPLTEEQSSTLTTWLQQHFAQRPCPACGTDLHDPAEILTVGGVRMVQLLCRRCKCIRLFDARSIFGG